MNKEVFGNKELPCDEPNISCDECLRTAIQSMREATLERGYDLRPKSQEAEAEAVGVAVTLEQSAVRALSCQGRKKRAERIGSETGKRWAKEEFRRSQEGFEE